MVQNDKRIRVITGHYGSGKTEFAVNYAMKLAEAGNKVWMVDLDIVNPYFRTRDKSAMLEEHGIRVIGSNIHGTAMDVPALSPEIYSVFENKNVQGILDVGGDKVGARALGRYHEYLGDEEFDMMLVLNANRPQTKTVEGAIKYIKEIEASSRQKVNGLVNNTHLCGETTIDEIIQGNELCKKVSQELGIPVKYNVIPRFLEDKIPEGLEGEAFLIEIYMKKPWE